MTNTDKLLEALEEVINYGVAFPSLQLKLKEALPLARQLIEERDELARQLTEETIRGGELREENKRLTRELGVQHHGDTDVIHVSRQSQDALYKHRDDLQSRLSAAEEENERLSEGR